MGETSGGGRGAVAVVAAMRGFSAALDWHALQLQPSITNPFIFAFGWFLGRLLGWFLGRLPMLVRLEKQG